MNYDELKQIWAQKYDTVPQQLEKLKQIPAVATAFNTNIDAILKITGESLKKLITDNHITVDELTNIELSNFRKPTDVIIGIVPKTLTFINGWKLI